MVCDGSALRTATEVRVREVGDDGGRRERGWIGGRERLGRAGSGSSCPDEAVRAGLPHTGRAGRAFVRADVVVRAGSRPCHTRRAGGFPSMPHVWQLFGPFFVSKALANNLFSSGTSDGSRSREHIFLFPTKGHVSCYVTGTKFFAGLNIFQCRIPAATLVKTHFT